ncbi:MAG: hypothetical protein Q8M98_11625 [Candidatus Cloacimonadaceae bacterium]|nr:hypothetical protein [Candidatus Cloacimonadaceae bacterium]
MKTAPVFIGTLNRSDHFKQAVESLKQNQLAQDTHLFIGLDYPSKDEHYSGYNQTLDYLENIKGFKEVTVFKRSTNMGAAKNFKDGQDNVLQLYDRIIISEDDNYFSPTFLAYMNAGLDKFESDRRIFGICGHNYPISFESKYSGNYYAWQGASVWGFGTWRDRYQSLNYTINDLCAYLRKPVNVIRAYRIAPHYIASMLGKVQSKADFDPFSDAVINLYLRNHNQYCIFPTLSKVRNFGHDGTGLRSGIIQGDNPFVTQAIDDATSFEFQSNTEELFENPAINRMLFRYFYRGPMQSLKTLWALLKYYIGNRACVRKT